MFGKVWTTPLLSALSLMFVASSCNKTQPQPEPEPEPLEIAIEVKSVVSDGAVVTVTPSDDEAWYLYASAESNVMADEYSDDPKLYFDSRIGEIMEQDGCDRKAAVAKIRRAGVSEETLSSLVPQTGYLVFAVGVDDDGLYSSAVFTASFTTSEEGEEPLPDGEFEVSVSDVTSGTAVVSVVPQDKAGTYYYDVARKSDYDSAKGDVSLFVTELIDYIVETNPGTTREDVVAALQVTGDSSDIIPNLTADTDFVAFAIGLASDGTCTTTASVKDFRTLPQGRPEDCVFFFKFPQTGTDYAYVSVIPSDNTVKYFASIIKVSEYVDDNALADRVFESVSLAAAEYGITLAEAVERLAYTGQSTEMHTDLVENTRYYAFAFAMSDGARPLGAISKTEFTTTGVGLSDCKVSLANVKWYDGDALADMDSKYEGIRGGAYFTADVVRSDNAKSWYVSLSAGDKTDPASFPDETVLAALVASAKPDQEKLAFAVYYGEATALGFAMDSDGVNGDVYRELFNITKEGASPVEDFVASSNIPLARMRNAADEPAPAYGFLFRR